jgi:hypothetical protein
VSGEYGVWIQRITVRQSTDILLCKSDFTPLFLPLALNDFTCYEEQWHRASCEGPIINLLQVYNEKCTVKSNDRSIYLNVT